MLIINIRNLIFKTNTLFSLLTIILTLGNYSLAQLNNSQDDSAIKLEKDSIILNVDSKANQRNPKSTNQNSLILPLPDDNQINSQLATPDNGNQERLIRQNNNFLTPTDLTSNNPNILKLQAQTCLHNKDFNSAKLYLKKLSLVNPNSFYAYCQLGNIDNKNNNPIGALKNFLIADYIKRDNFIVTANINAIGKYIQQNINHKFSASYLTGARSEGNKNGLLTTGIIFYSLGYLNDAKDIFAYLLKNDPSCTRAWLSLSVIEIVSGNLTLAKTLLEKAKSINSNKYAQINRYLSFVNQQINIDQANNLNYSSDRKYPLIKVGNSVAPKIFASEGNLLPVRGAYCQYCLHLRSRYNAGIVE